MKKNNNSINGGNLYVSNAFSLQMMDEGVIEVENISKATFDSMKVFAYSIMGHEDMANLHELPFNRESITLKKGDQLLVAQITSGRLPEGATTMPENVTIGYKLVSVY